MSGRCSQSCTNIPINNCYRTEGAAYAATLHRFGTVQVRQGRSLRPFLLLQVLHRDFRQSCYDTSSKLRPILALVRDHGQRLAIAACYGSNTVPSDLQCFLIATHAMARVRPTIRLARPFTFATDQRADGLSVSGSWLSGAIRRYRVAGCSGLRKGIEQIAGPLIACGAVFPHARRELRTPMLACRNKK
jgi:hypothetical protein